MHSIRPESKQMQKQTKNPQFDPHRLTIMYNQIYTRTSYKHPHAE